MGFWQEKKKKKMRTTRAIAAIVIFVFILLVEDAFSRNNQYAQNLRETVESVAQVTIKDEQDLLKDERFLKMLQNLSHEVTQIGIKNSRDLHSLLGQTPQQLDARARNKNTRSSQDSFAIAHKRISRYLTHFYSRTCKRALEKIPRSLEIDFAREFYFDGGFFMDGDNDPSHIKPIQEVSDQLTQRNKYHMFVMDGGGLEAFSKGGDLIVFGSDVATVLNEDERAGIVGHEIAHLERRDYICWQVIEQVNRIVVPHVANGFNFTNENQTSNQQEELWKSMFQSFKLAYQRHCELSCDRWSVDRCLKNGYDPINGLVSVFKNHLNAGDAAAQVSSSLLSSHPVSDFRAERIQKYLSRMLRRFF